MPTGFGKFLLMLIRLFPPAKSAAESTRRIYTGNNATVTGPAKGKCPIFNRVQYFAELYKVPDFCSVQTQISVTFLVITH